MNSKRMYSFKYSIQSIDSVIIIGLLLRITILFFILFVFKDFIDIYMFADDVNYEKLALRYLQSATSVIDYDTFASIGGAGYLQVFWPWVLCISSYLFKTQFAGRFINILLSTIIIKIIYNLVFEISDNTKTALKAAKMYAFFPASAIFCCFPFKDIYISLVVFFTFHSMVLIQSDTKLSLKRSVVNIALLVGLYFARGAVTELLIIFILGQLLVESYQKKRYDRLLMDFALTGVFIILFAQDISIAFSKKMNDYFYTDFARTTGTAIAIVRIDSIYQIWKLPLTYAYSLLNPFTLNLFTRADSESIWSHIVSVGNIVIYPVAIGNIFYIFKKKHNLYLWTTSLIMYLAVIVMSLGISRHYYFLYPLALVNYSLFLERSRAAERNNIKIGTICLIVLVYLISILRS